MNDFALEGNLLRRADGDQPPERTPRPLPICMASLMREHGPTGVQTHMRVFRQSLEDSGGRCFLVTPWAAPPWKAGAIWMSRRLIQLAGPDTAIPWRRHSYQKLLAAALAPALRELRRCVIYAQCPISAAAALTARRSCEQSVVMAVHFNISEADEWVGKRMLSKQGPAYAAIRRFEEKLLPRLDGLVYVSDFMREQLLQRLPTLATSASIVLPNFVHDPGRVASISHEGDLISIGTLEPRKNQAYLLEILVAAKRAGQPLSLTLVGDGPARGQLEWRASQLGIRDQVRFTGYVPDGARLLQAHRAYIHSATLENMPLTLIEALAWGKPVFALPVGGIPEVFSDEVEGRYLPQGDAPRAADLLLEWLRQPARLAAASAAARARYLARFESTAVAGRLADFLQSTVPAAV